MNKEELKANYQKYLERIEVYKKQGFDRIKNYNKIITLSEPLGEKILEIGTGKGYQAIEIAKRGYKFISLDIDKESVKFATMNLKYLNLKDNVQIIMMDAVNTSFPDKYFNSIITSDSLHHLDKPQSVFNEMLRLIKDDGKIIIAEFTDKGFNILDNIHKMEGRTHSRGNTRMKDAIEFFSIRGFNHTSHNLDVQELVIFTKK